MQEGFLQRPGNDEEWSGEAALKTGLPVAPPIERLLPPERSIEAAFSATGCKGKGICHMSYFGVVTSLVIACL